MIQGPAPSGSILVADADQEARSLIASSLEEAGFTVDEAVCGRSALDSAMASAPLVAILDVSLPNVCGYEVLYELRGRYGPDLPIILMSASRTETFDRVGGLLLGADDYLAKPLALDELLARTRRLLSRAMAVPAAVAMRLTKREREILRMLAAGEEPLDIARQLVVSPKTIDSHIQHMKSKFGAQSRGQLVALALRPDASAAVF